MLLAYVATHLTNHALGLVSLEAAEAARLWFIGFWRSLPGTGALYASLAVHVALAFMALFERHTLRMPAAEALRLVLGFSVPILLAAHATNTRLAHELYGREDNYAFIAAAIWSNDWGLVQVALMLAAWVHGCLGLHLVLRHRAAYRRRFHFFFAGAALLPTLAYLGFVAMAREAGKGPGAGLDPAQRATLDRFADGLEAGFAVLIATVFAARVLRAWTERRRGTLVTIHYPGRSVSVPQGWTVLEASRANGIPHLSLCGGRGRCSTCRVQVEASQGGLPPVGPDEQRTLLRVRAPAGVRLACQLRPTSDLRVTPLLSASASAVEFDRLQFGQEREVAILFIDLRRWTGMAEKHLPYDLVYVLDQYFAAVGDAVRAAGGVPNQFIGDSVMAIFGLQCGLGSACRQALAAARGIETSMCVLNERVQREFNQALDFGMGLHAGRAAVGEVGYRDTRSVSAVGDAVNIASRLQELAKDYGVRLVLSGEVARAARLHMGKFPGREIAVRGRAAPLTVYPVESALALPG